MSAANDESEDLQFTPELLSIIRQAAEILVRKYAIRAGQAEEFLGEAPSIIYLCRERFDPERPIEPWVFQVLRNALISRFRQQKSRDNLLRNLRAQLNDSDFVIQPSQFAVDFCEPFSPSDMEILESHPPRPRFVSLAVLDLWRKVLLDAWRRWCDEQQVSPPFPDAEFESRGRSGRIAILARRLRSTEQAVRMALSRGVCRLRELDEFKVRMGR